ncbi:hypothetical protein GC174_00230 [bacterium]|nr:hypothetical protein [bacterium]
MFQAGQVLKVKVESSPGEYGYGRATIVDRDGNNLLVQIKTSRDSNKILPRGTKVWFVNDSPRLTFNGFWYSSVTGKEIVKGRTVLICSLPKLEPLSQRRNSHRVNVDVPVTISLDIEGKERQEFRTRDLCKSGSAIETSRLDASLVEVGKEIGCVLHTDMGDVKLKARVIRIEENWLAKKTTLALEFIALSKESSDTLDRLLVKLGGKPRDSKLEEVAGKTGAKDGLSAWVRQVKRDERDVEASEETAGGDDLEVVEAQQDDSIGEDVVEGGGEKVASQKDSGDS